MAHKKRQPSKRRASNAHRAKGETTPEKQYYHDPNDAYYTEHFEELVDNHGGKWIVMADGEVVAICYAHEMDPYIDQIRARGIVPFAAPIPRPEEIECLL
jgi:hypothetical protein